MNETPLMQDHRRAARFLYWQGWPLAQIADYLAENAKTVRSWKSRDQWDNADAAERVGGALEVRLMQLILKDAKTGGDYKEIDLLHRQLERQARISRYQHGGNEADLNPKVANRNAKAKEPAKRNSFTEDEIEQLQAAFLEQCFDYQKDWYRAGNQRTRMILKSRQIGATFYFAREALMDALITGRNQIFLSASKAQAHQFKSYMQAFVNEVTGKPLTGDPIVLGHNNAELHFLGTNFRTAQGRSGNFYFDEFFWTQSFEELNKVASGMALHKKWRKTYFSTPSSMAHPAYKWWTGERVNRGRPKAQQIQLDVAHQALAQGRLCEDKIWRQIVTILDAQQRGCDLFDIDELRFEYNAEQFANLLMCEFVDDGASIFPLAMLQPCMVDSWEQWTDYKPFALRPLADRPVWVGYDPAESGDSAGMVVVAPPQVAGGKFRVIERVQFKGMDFAAQARAIEQVTQRYFVTYIGLDGTGMGAGVAQLVKQFFPALTTFSYSPQVKTALVLKAYDVIKNARLEYDAGWTDLSQSLMAIRKTVTASGRQFTYTAGRSDETGHADLAWGLFHALQNEPLEGRTETNSGFMEMF
ncbi:terminase large subunit domain-containing protein [Celerinatantimonas sp. MCCC 1A17872]|uniref:terminase large subunit domain-containing protein n=1 Tax=Celerinatantimonas sp. MCCC 1A17872 TaxID=3177514 RepID=UPI0038CA7386